MQEKITFITNKEHKISCPTITMVDRPDVLINFLERCKRGEANTGFDTENNSLNHFKAEHLLKQFGNEEEVYVLDSTSIDHSFLNDYTDLNYLGQNLLYDYLIMGWNEGRPGIHFNNLSDLMIHEQIIGRGLRRSNSLESIHLRRLGVEYPEDKETRKDFIKMKRNKAVFNNIHIKYAGADIRVLFAILRKQQAIINQEGLGLRVYDIGDACIHILGEMCLNGSLLDKDKWLKVLNENKKLKKEIEIELDKELIKVGYKTKVRKRQEVIVYDLFGMDTPISNECKANVKYSSDIQILKIYDTLGLPVPMKKNNKTHLMMPSVAGEALEQYNLDNPGNKLYEFNKLLIELYGITKRINSFGINFLEHIYADPSKPNSKNNLIYGFHNPLTGKVHTRYKQETTENGRLSSGSDKTGKQKTKKLPTDVFFNSQQLPKESRYREPFILEPELAANDWWRTTIDLGSAELVILGAQARDTKLLDLHFNGDLHSHLATNGFNRIIRYIINNMSEQRARIELHELLRVNKVFEIVVAEDEKGNFLRFYTQDEKNAITRRRVEEALDTKGFVINKKTAKDIRDTVKNAVYGSLYGATGDRIATTLSVARDYGQMFLDSMYDELPIAFGYLKMKAVIAIREGYVIFNDRSKSRHIFNSWQEAKKWGKELTKSEIGDITRKTMNYIISGTQADMIKEGMVEVDKYFKTGTTKVLEQSWVAEQLMNEYGRKVDHKWIFQVHDELVFDHRYKPHANVAGKILTTVAGYYLNGLAEMGANIVTLKSWTK